MEPLKLQELYDLLVGLGEVDPSTQPVLPMAIADAFETLTEDERDLSDDEKRALYEVSLMLSRFGFRGKQAEALNTLMSVQMENPGFDFRPATEEEVEDLADLEAEE